MNPPKCKTCGKEEWNHTCGPVFTSSDLKTLATPKTSGLSAPVKSGECQTSSTANGTLERGKKSSKAIPQSSPKDQNPKLRDSKATTTARTSKRDPSSSSGRTTDFESVNPRSNRGEGTKFDRNAYQRDYMAAKRAGMTLKAWRERMK